MIEDFGKLCLPYCIVRRPDGLWLVLNRGYQPVASTGGVNWDQLEGLPFGDELVRVLRRVATSCRNEPDGAFKAWLWNGSCVPWRSAAHWNSYAKRLRALSAITHAGDGQPKPYPGPPG